MLKSLYRQIVGESWHIGFVDNSLQEVMEGGELRMDYLKHNYRDRWFADPFIVDVTANEIVLLAEEYILEDRKARIAELTVEKASHRLKGRKTVVERQQHISFPQVIRKMDGYDDELLIMPENSRSMELNVYDKNGIKKGTLLSGQISDAVYTRVFGDERIFSTQDDYLNGNKLDVWKKEVNSYVLEEQVAFADNTARNAGDFFEYDGDIYRPAQICNHIYGEGICIQKVIRAKDRFSFEDYMRIYPPRPYVGIHTWNMCRGQIVTDVHEVRHHIISRQLFLWRNRKR